MAKGKKSFENMGAGLFGESQEKNKDSMFETNSISPKFQEQEEANQVLLSHSPQGRKKRKVGKPKDDDLQENEDTIPTIVQLTKSTKYTIDKYTLERGYKSRSQAIRELIRNL